MANRVYLRKEEATKLTLALNSGKIGELNISPDLFSQFMKTGSK